MEFDGSSSSLPRAWPEILVSEVETQLVQVAFSFEATKKKLKCEFG